MTHAIGCLLRPLKFHFLELRLKWVLSARLWSRLGCLETCTKVFLGQPVPTLNVSRGKKASSLLLLKGGNGYRKNYLKRGSQLEMTVQLATFWSMTVPWNVLTVCFFGCPGSVICRERGPVVVWVRIRHAAPGQDGHDRVLLQRLWTDIQDEPACPSAGLAVSTPSQGHHQDGM